MQSATESTVYEKELQIDASPETVWQFLIDPEKVARWKGLPASAFDVRPGGDLRIEIIPGRVASGSFVEIDEPHRLVYTWGWEPRGGDANPVPPGSSTVEIELVAANGGTMLRFVHRDLPSAESTETHAVGWDHYLSRLAVAAVGADPGRDPWLGDEA